MKLNTLTAALLLSLGLALPGQAETFRHAQGETTLTAVPERVLVFDVATLDTLTALV